MHELSLCQALCRQLEQEVAARRLSRVLRVELVIGSLGCLDPRSLAFCFAAIDKPPALQGCQLVFRRQPGAARCRDCQVEYELHRWLQACPRCGSLNRSVEGGDGVLIEQMEVL